MMGRPAKRVKTKLEKLIMETWYETGRGEKPCSDKERMIIEAIKATLRHFEMEDYLYGSRHIKIFTTVYLSAKFEKSAKNKNKRRIVLKTKAAFAHELYIGRNSLSTYTDYYIKCFEKNLNEIFPQ